jgi:hypothetical protein
MTSFTLVATVLRSSNGHGDVTTPVAIVLRSSNGHGDVTMPVVTVPVYKELDIVPTSSSSDKAQCESQLFVHTVAKKFEKSGRGFDFIFLEIDSRR